MSRDTATRHWQALEPILTDLVAPDHLNAIGLYRSEYEHWCGHPEVAIRHLEPALRAAVDNDESAACGPLLTSTMRALADLADLPTPMRLAPRRAQLDVEELTALAARMKLDPFGPGPLRPAALAHRATFDAELSRLRGTASADAWDKAAAQWEHLDRPHRAGYARWRQAETLLAQSSRHPEAAACLRLAAAHSQQHQPQLDAIRTLARRAHITLTEPEPRPGPADTHRRQQRPFNLTERELAVLTLLAEGHSNARIGQALFISTSTVGVHISNILRKLNVATRVQAATVAERHGLTTATPHDTVPDP